MKRRLRTKCSPLPCKKRLFVFSTFSDFQCLSHKLLNQYYTLSHPENDCDVTERAQGYTLQDASFMRQSRCSFLNAWENTQVARAMTSKGSSSGLRADVTVVLEMEYRHVCTHLNGFLMAILNVVTKFQNFDFFFWIFLRSIVCSRLPCKVWPTSADDHQPHDVGWIVHVVEFEQLCPHIDLIL